MRCFAVFVVFLISSTAINCQESSPHLAELHKYGSSLAAEGVWRADIPDNKAGELLPSVTRLECYKHGGAELTGSDAYCMEATAEIHYRNPAIGVTYYPVLKWDRETVIAADSPTAQFPICTWTQITINLRDNSIMATDTRKLGKGREGFANMCMSLPLAKTYHLVDEAEEFTRRELREQRMEKKPKK